MSEAVNAMERNRNQIDQNTTDISTVSNESMKIQTAEPVDLDTLFTAGTKYYTTGSTNTPDGGQGYVIVGGNGVDRASQTAVTLQNKMFTRISVDGATWSTWTPYAEVETYGWVLKWSGNSDIVNVSPYGEGTFYIVSVAGSSQYNGTIEYKSGIHNSKVVYIGLNTDGTISYFTNLTMYPTSNLRFFYQYNNTVTSQNIIEVYKWEKL